MILNISTSIRHEGEQTRVVHRFHWETGGFDWNLTYPVKLLPTPALYLQPLTYAYCFFSGAAGKHTVRVNWQAEKFEKDLQWLWMDRCRAEKLEGLPGGEVESVSLECGPLKLKPSKDSRMSQHAVMFSFGKESVLTRRLLLECGIRPVCFYRVFEGEQSAWSAESPEGFMPVKSNIRIGRSSRSAFGEFTQMLFLPLVDAMGITDLTMGNEYEQILDYSMWGYDSCCAFQSNPNYMKLASRLASLACERKVDAYSVIYALPQLRVLKEMWLNYRDDWNRFVRSCWNQNKHRQVSWCGKCPKCYQIHSLFLRGGLTAPFQMKLSKNRITDVSGCVITDDPELDRKYYDAVNALEDKVQESGFAEIPNVTLRKKIRSLLR